METYRVLHLVHTPGPGGTEKVVLNLLEWMPQASVSQALGAPRGPLGNAAETMGIMFHDIPFHSVHRSPSLLTFFSYMQRMRRVDKALREALDVTRPNVVHSHGLKTTILSGLVGGRKRPWKLVWHLHDYVPIGPLRRLLIPIALRQADTVVAVSKDVGNVVCGTGKFRIIPNAIASPPRQTARGGEALRMEYGIAPSDPLLGYAGRLDHEKGIASLFDSLILSKLPNVHLLIAGASPFRPRQMQALWEKESSERNLQHRVHFLGRLPDLTDFFQAIDVFVLPAPREPFGLVILEAFAHGVPVVACNAGGPQEIIGHLEWSPLVPPNNPRALAGAYDRLLQTNELVAQAAQEGPKIIDQRYSPHVQTRAMVSLYREVVFG